MKKRVLVNCAIAVFLFCLFHWLFWHKTPFAVNKYEVGIVTLWCAFNRVMEGTLFVVFAALAAAANVDAHHSKRTNWWVIGRGALLFAALGKLLFLSWGGEHRPESWMWTAMIFVGAILFGGISLAGQMGRDRS